MPAEMRGTTTSRASVPSCDCPLTAAEELAAQINDCYSLFPCIDAHVAVSSIQPSPLCDNTVTARVPWQKVHGETTERHAVEVYFSYREGFVNNGCAYESLLQLLIANGCGVRDNPMPESGEQKDFLER
ncbi:hypothetical protein TRVL_04315 [Trypanosoma vivax]|uniref:Uncharacterized protein n=1 Tax=Trypanosoma vivax (strain Y486) TaxID=1055687 RepID=G0U0A8_TRYVY|nr:hypothetical protein TRVL_04315 [Trypanosoma vivax]CCC49506.1 conserved hypothetical protein [Trypanosoma vivax Y486]